MSVTRSVKTEMNEQNSLRDALKNLGHKPTVQEPATIRGHYNEKSRQKCDLVLRKEDTGRQADIGFAKDKDGNYEIVTDTYVNRDIKLDDFAIQIKTEYTKVQTKKIASKIGATFLGERKLPNGQIVLRFAKA